VHFEAMPLTGGPLEIILEASRRPPDTVKERHPNIDCVAIASAGNIYRHNYEMIGNFLLWNTTCSPA
jgi:uncharacterized protein with HEPN domain